MKIETRLKIPYDRIVPVETYPVLAVQIGGKPGDMGKVVLFSSASVGTVVCADASERFGPVGYSGCNWISPYDKTFWEILPSGSEVTIKQS